MDLIRKSPWNPSWSGFKFNSELIQLICFIPLILHIVRCSPIYLDHHVVSPKLGSEHHQNLSCLFIVHFKVCKQQALESHRPHKVICFPRHPHYSQNPSLAQGFPWPSSPWWFNSLLLKMATYSRFTFKKKWGDSISIVMLVHRRAFQPNISR